MPPPQRNRWRYSICLAQFHANISQYQSVGNTDIHLYFNFEREILNSMKIIAGLNELLNSRASHPPICMHVHATWHRSRTSTQHAYSYWKFLNSEFIYRIVSENTSELISWEKKLKNKKQCVSKLRLLNI